MGGSTFVGNSRYGISDKFGQFSRGRAVIDAVEVGVFLECDKTMLVDMAQCTL